MAIHLTLVLSQPCAHQQPACKADFIVLQQVLALSAEGWADLALASCRRWGCSSWPASPYRWRLSSGMPWAGLFKSCMRSCRWVESVSGSAYVLAVRAFPRKLLASRQARLVLPAAAVHLMQW